MISRSLAVVFAFCTACASSSSDSADAGRAQRDGGGGGGGAVDAGAFADAGDPAVTPDANAVGPDARTRSLAAMRVVTFNSGTNTGLRHDDPPDDGYTSTEAELSDQYYGDGLAWTAVVAETRAFFERIDADVVVFQEIFYSGDCPSIPESAYPGFVCENWRMGDPTVAQAVLGDRWQVMCNPGKTDKCAAVNRDFGTFRGCDSDFCIEGMQGFRVNDCGSGARIGRGTIDLVAGGNLTLVLVHGTSGAGGNDRDCRKKQVDQVFVDLGDGDPGANGTNNLIMGDFNTDPGRAALLDASARRWNDFVGASRAFRFITEIGSSATPTYEGLANIDHVVSDTLRGSCWTGGITEGRQDITDTVYFDHHPIVCDIGR